MTPQAGSAVSRLDDCVLRLLVGKGILAEAIARKAEEVERAGGPVALDWLVEDGLLIRNQVDSIAAEAFGMVTVDLSRVSLSPEWGAEIPRSLALRYGILPLAMDSGEVRIAVSDPHETAAPDALGHLLGRPVSCRLAPRRAIERAIDRCFPAGEEGLLQGDDLGLPAPADGGEDGGETPIIEYVRELITEGLRRRASDMHLEPLEKRFRIRYRVDGVLQEMDGPPKRLQLPIVSRIKLMAGMSIAERRVPQDGRIRFVAAEKTADLRVSSLPTSCGESIVMRILETGTLRQDLPELGLFEEDRAELERIITAPDGMFIVTGPTGSGKSTTLYAALKRLNSADRKLITVEDPVEYELAGVNQVQVRPEVGMTFAAALRAMLRQAPNVIMVGEIRDRETAGIAVNAALTGHMVFSTLHTNDAPGAINRLVDIRVKPFLVSAALRAVLAQRLVRRICPHCRERASVDERLLRSIGIDPGRVTADRLARGRGCRDCSESGFRGRIGLFEILRFSDALSRMVHDGATQAQLRAKAREEGMRSMREDGARKVLAGLTAPEEILRATTC